MKILFFLVGYLLGLPVPYILGWLNPATRAVWWYVRTVKWGFLLYAVFPPFVLIFALCTLIAFFDRKSVFGLGRWGDQPEEWEVPTMGTTAVFGVVLWWVILANNLLGEGRKSCQPAPVRAAETVKVEVVRVYGL